MTLDILWSIWSSNNDVLNLLPLFPSHLLHELQSPRLNKSAQGLIAIPYPLEEVIAYSFHELEIGENNLCRDLLVIWNEALTECCEFVPRHIHDFIEELVDQVELNLWNQTLDPLRQGEK